MPLLSEAFFNKIFLIQVNSCEQSTITATTKNTTEKIRVTFMDLDFEG
jgi:hypothetical protein